MGQTLTETGAETIRWRLDELYESPDDAAIERTLAGALKNLCLNSRPATPVC